MSSGDQRACDLADQLLKQIALVPAGCKRGQVAKVFEGVDAGPVAVVKMNGKRIEANRFDLYGTNGVLYVFRLEAWFVRPFVNAGRTRASAPQHDHIKGRFFAVSPQDAKGFWIQLGDVLDADVFHLMDPIKTEVLEHIFIFGVKY